MDPIRNPFVPGAGAAPPEIAGRERLIGRAEIALRRALQGRPAKSFIAVGLRGVGKTVVLNRVRNLADELGYRSCAIEAQEAKSLPELLIPHLRRMTLELDRIGALSEHVKRALRVLKSFTTGLKVRYGDLQLDVQAEAGVADSGDLEADLPELIAALGRAAKARETGIALVIDEIQFLGERDMSALIIAMHRVMQEQLPVVMVAAGLPQVVALSGRSKSYAERLFDYPALGALSDEDARTALVEPARREEVAFSDAALDAILRITEGYPYFLQEWAYQAWNVAEGPVIDAADVSEATGAAIEQLDGSFFRMRYERLTPRERAYCQAMAELGPGPHRSGDIAARLGLRVQTVGPLRQNLIRKGMVYSPAHGDTAFTVPMFDQYLHRLQGH
ncbi:DNA-binding CsgD family transcriptional regulator [Endobacter medicaginis]|uniref:ATP-binding protein n=1 Tax=Endobacter medicaginis TaxID=1181271 RepID=A0A850NKS6_9PROT|nr:ATP-binding protein [Endobacter medicaginis]MBB3174237.1 DNA-binding CsgD family transcriptional regulator [Endobacter medicaginis]MCX5474281.1 ATP-binding protein [Endobacter medicaginis]NVN29079.1 ATP-binding protein [Endobacter medicaginis]